MDRPTLVKQIDDVLADWERKRQWGELWVEVKDGVPTLMKATTQQKLNSFQLGGMPQHVRRENR